MESFWIIIGIVMAIGATILIPIVFSKMFNARVTYRGGTIAEPDELDEIVKKGSEIISKGRAKVDLKFAQKRRIKDEYQKEVKPILVRIRKIESGMRQYDVEKFIEDRYPLPGMEEKNIEIEKFMIDVRNNNIREVNALKEEAKEIKIKYERMLGEKLEFPVSFNS